MTLSASAASAAAVHQDGQVCGQLYRIRILFYVKPSGFIHLFCLLAQAKPARLPTHVHPIHVQTAASALP